ncbi:MAG: HNH endonuclease [Deltaproteobacteria bacterium]|nr:HNH endonuclease [Deltaproteobacteria bacterium]
MSSRFSYSRASWKRLRAAKLRANPLCEHCIKPTVATQVDHIVAIAKGGDPYDWDNLQSLCASCHSRKTNREDNGAFNAPRDRRVDPQTGRPLDVDHWWNTGKESLATESVPPVDGPKDRVI